MSAAIINSLIPKCTACGNSPRIAPHAYLEGVAVHDEHAREVRGLDQYGPQAQVMSWTDEDLADCAKESHIITGEDADVIASSVEDPVGLLEEVGMTWAAAVSAERAAAAAAYTLIRWAANLGISESEIARRVGVDRMTVRRALGKM